MKTWGGIRIIQFFSLLIPVIAALALLAPCKVHAAADPSITAQPQSQSVLAGSNVVFTVVASGQTPLFYQWSFNGNNLADGTHISGATSATLTVSNVVEGDAGNYQVVVSNSHGSVTSSNATLLVVPVAAWGDDYYGETDVPLTATDAVAVSAGVDFSLALKNDGTVIGWGSDYEGATDLPAGLGNVTAIAAGGHFGLALKNNNTAVGWGDDTYGEADPPAGLSNVVAVAAGFDFGLALKSDGTVIGWGDDYSGQTDPPAGLSNVAAIAAGNNFSLALKRDGTVVGWGYDYDGETDPPAGLSNVVAIAAGSDFGLALQSDGTVVGWGYNNNGVTNTPAGLSNVVSIAAGWSFGLALKGDETVSAWGGGFVPTGLGKVVSIAAGYSHSLALIQDPSVQVPPTIWWEGLTNNIVPANQTLVFLPYLHGSLPTSFQWYSNGAPLPGETNQWLILEPGQQQRMGDYQFVVSNNYGSVTSQVAAVFESPGILTQPTSELVLVGSNAEFTVSAIGPGTLHYQWYFNGAPLIDSDRISGATTTNLVIYGVQTNDAGNYQLNVTNDYGSAGATATLTVLFPPAIATQPQSQFALLHSNVTFTVTAVGPSPLSYQWYSDGIPLGNYGTFSGATSPALTIYDVQTNNAASYQVIVANLYGAATSSVVALTVILPVQITQQPASEAVLLGGNTTFSVNATGSGPLAYHWYFNRTPLSDGGRISGSTTPVLNISNVQSNDAGGYVAVITNLLSSATSQTASLTPQASPGPSVRYVNLNNPNPTPPYLDWNTAATNIQDAVDAAVAGDTVIVSNGIYQSGWRTVYGTYNRVAVNKAVTIQSVNGPAGATILGGAISPAYDNTVRCVYLTNGASLSGFTLKSGGTGLVDRTNWVGAGGGLWCESSQAVISNCVFSGNYASQYGGGAFRGTLFNCLLTNNSAYSGGGGAASNTLVNCILAKNTVTGNGYGGGAIGCTLSNCLLVANQSSSGGGAYASSLTGCVVSNNLSAGPGGGLCFGSANFTLICGNYASNSYTGYGGGAYSSTLNNCVAENNRAGVYGGGAYGGMLVNCTVVSNTTQIGGGVQGGNLTNCIVYYNTGYGASSNFQSANLAYCDTLPLAPGAGNITNAPLFVNLAAGDLHLQSNSPCINSGYNPAVIGTNDFDGNPRIVGGTVDMGAYEYQTPSSTLSYAWAQQYGLPTDGSVDYLDLDGTGMNNWQKWIAGLNPTNPASVLAMSSLTVWTNYSTVVTVSWQSVSNRMYYLQRASNLSGQPAFSTISRNIIGQPGTTSYTDYGVLHGGPWFYRVGVQY